MRGVVSVSLVLLLAGCAKQTPPVVTAAPAKPAVVKTAAPEAAPVPAPAPAAPAPDAAATEALLKKGGEIYSQTCATCHMADGNGVPFMQPQIAGSAWISNPDPQLLLTLILRGSAVLGEAAHAYDNDMAPQDALSDADIAAVASYVRHRFATPPITKPVTPAEVAVARARPGLPQ